MSDYGLFDAATDAENAPARQARTAANKLANAIDAVRDGYGGFLLSASGKDEFEDRWHYSKNDIRKSVNEHVPPVTGIMRRVHDALKRDFVATIGDDNREDPTKAPKNDGDKNLTVNDRQKSKIDKGDKSVTDEVETNTGDGSDAEGKNKDPNTPKRSDPRKASLAGHPNQDLPEGREVSDADLIPTEHTYDDNGEQAKVQVNFGQGGDTGREASRMAVQMYADWARSNGMRVGSLNTLEHYADLGIGDSEYFHIANRIRIAGDDCDCDDDKDSDDSDSDSSDGPPPPAKKSESESDSDSGDSGDDDSSGDSDSDSDEGSDDGDDSGSDSVPFGGDDSGDDTGGDEDPAGPPEDDAGFDGPPEGPQGLDDDPDAAPAGPDVAGDPADDPGAPAADEAAGGDFPDAAGPGDEFSIPDAPPQLPGDEMDQLSGDDSGTENLPPEIIDDILGLPPGTIEQLVMQELSGGGGDDPGGPPPPEDPSAHLARSLYRDAIRRSAAEDPSSGGGDSGSDPAAGGQAVSPAASAPAPAASPTQPGPDDGALLDQASQAVTQLVDTKTQEFQTVMDPLQQALQAIQFAQQVENAANPLDATPPEGTVDATPSAAPAAQAVPGAAPAAPNQGLQVAARHAHREALVRHAEKLADHFGLSRKGHAMVLEAMGRRQYEHVAEAISQLANPQDRMQIASSMADMFREDNMRFNAPAFMASAGITASRRPFVVRSRTTGGGRASERTAAPSIPTGGQTLDAFEHKGTRPGGKAAAPKFDDNIDGNELPKMPGAAIVGGIADDFGKWQSGQESKGLAADGDVGIHQFEDAQPGKVGPRGNDILHKSLGLQPEPKAKVGFFQPKVAGWQWDDHLNGYITSSRKPFICTTAGCKTAIDTPSYVNCRCGRIWNTYAIGDSSRLASNDADMYIAREIPVRENVIMANRQFQAEEEGFNESGDGPFQDYAEDVEFFDDSESDEHTPHAPGETINDTTRSASYRYAEDLPEQDHNVVYRDGERFCSACDALLWDPNVHHCPAKQASFRNAFEVVDAGEGPVVNDYTDEDNAGYTDGPSGPPDTALSNPRADWARVDGRGRFAPNIFGH